MWTAGVLDWSQLFGFKPETLTPTVVLDILEHRAAPYFPAGNGEIDSATYHEGLDEIRPAGGASRVSEG